MGHIRLGRLPRTRKWRQVVELLDQDASVGRVAGAAAAAAESALHSAHDDPAFTRSFWLLTQIPLAARSADFAGELVKLGLQTGTKPTLLVVTLAVTRAIDDHVAQLGGRTDLGEMAQLAVVESLATVASRDLPSLFEPTPSDVKLALARLAAPDRFAALARDFFARLTRRHLDYYLSRELSKHVGPDRKLSSTDAHTAFNSALELHAREASRIVEAFAGGWYSKARFEGRLTPETARRFAWYAFRKIQHELKRRQGDDA